MEHLFTFKNRLEIVLIFKWLRQFQTKHIIVFYFQLMQVFHTGLRWWDFAEVWVTASLLRGSGFFWVFLQILTGHVFSIYHLSLWSNFGLLHNSQWITQSYLVFCSFCVRLRHSFIVWLIVSFQLPHNTCYSLESDLNWFLWYYFTLLFNEIQFLSSGFPFLVMSRSVFKFLNLSLKLTILLFISPFCFVIYFIVVFLFCLMFFSIDITITGCRN